MFPSAWLLKKLSLTVGIFTPKDGAVNAEHGLLLFFTQGWGLRSLKPLKEWHEELKINHLVNRAATRRL